MLEKQLVQEFLAKRNVVSVGEGFKIINGRTTKQPCITVLVIKKEPVQSLSARSLLPNTVEDTLIDVIESGPLRAFKLRTDRFRPMPGGISIGHHLISAGTLGCWVKSNDEWNKDRFILSNNHVLANTNAGKIEDRILQPGPHDGGHVFNDLVARLFDFEPLYFEDDNGNSGCKTSSIIINTLNFIAQGIGSRALFSYQHPNAVQSGPQQSNYMDAAIARVEKLSYVKETIEGYGRIFSTPKPASLDMKIKKSGRTTGCTTGKILQLNATTRIGYEGGKEALLENQIIASGMSNPGDSGSLVLTMDGYPIGLLFAGSAEVTIMSPIQVVLDRFKVQIVGD